MGYFANGSEGECLSEQCADCVLGKGPCPVLGVQLQHNYEQIGNEKLRSAMNLLVDPKGICQVRKQLKSLEEDVKPTILEYLEKTSGR